MKITSTVPEARKLGLCEVYAYGIKGEDSNESPSENRTLFLDMPVTYLTIALQVSILYCGI